MRYQDLIRDSLSLPKYLGFMAARRLGGCRDLAILMVHGVIEDDPQRKWSPLRPRVSVRMLENSLSVLSRYYKFISLDEAVKMIRDDLPFKSHSIALTFDDGYRNSIQKALPVLRRYGVSPTIFVATGNIEQRKPFWFDRLDYALQQIDVAGRCFQVGDHKIIFSSNERKELKSGYKAMRFAAKQILSTERDIIKEMEEMAEGLEKESGKCLKEFFEKDQYSSLLTWEEINQAADDGVSFGSHTVDHSSLGLMDEVDIRRQLIHSKKTLEDQIGRPCPYLCYPSGSFSLKAIEVAREVGYEAGLTSYFGLNRRGQDPMSLRRIHIPEKGSMNDLLATLAGWNGYKNLLRKTFR